MPRCIPLISLGMQLAKILHQFLGYPRLCWVSSILCGEVVFSIINRQGSHSSNMAHPTSSELQNIRGVRVSPSGPCQQKGVPNGDRAGPIRNSTTERWLLSCKSAWNTKHGLPQRDSSTNRIWGFIYLIMKRTFPNPRTVGKCKQRACISVVLVEADILQVLKYIHGDL